MKSVESNGKNGRMRSIDPHTFLDKNALLGEFKGNEYFIIMNDKKKNEELQSRREFFKKAAKATLPVIGAIVLSTVPTFANAAKTPSGCQGTCIGMCYGSCKGCQYTCSGTCSSGCKGCQYTCSGTCSGSCKTSCQYSNK